MNWDDFLTAFTDYAQNTGLVLGDLTEDDLYHLLQTASELVDAVHAELEERSTDHPQE